MFPSSITTDITLYTRWVDPVTGLHHNIRSVLKGCSWQDNSIQIFKETGTQVTNNVSLFIPFLKEVTGREYIQFSKWLNIADKNELSKYWSLNLRPVLNNQNPALNIPNRPIVYKGVSEFEFQPMTTTALTTAENNLTNSNPDYRRIVDINENLIGSMEMRHILIRM